MKYCLVLVLMGWGWAMAAQSTDSLTQEEQAFLLEPDSLVTLEDEGPRFNPKRALLYAIVPGGGQIYNRRWWKLPIVYGTFAGLVAVIEDNQRNYQRFQSAYQLALNEEPHEFTGTRLDSPASLRNLRDAYDKNRQTAYVIIVVAYAMQGIEAFVDAHLRDFDIDDDLSFKLQPKLQVPPPYVLGGGPIPSLSLTFQW